MLNWQRIIPASFCSILRGEQPSYRFDEQFFRDYFYVADTALVISLYWNFAEQIMASSSHYGRK